VKGKRKYFCFVYDSTHLNKISESEAIKTIGEVKTTEYKNEEMLKDFYSDMLAEEL